MNDSSRLLTPGEVAAMVRVDVKTVSRWARAGKLPSVSTGGGHRRYREADVQAMMNAPAPDKPGKRTTATPAATVRVGSGLAYGIHLAPVAAEPGVIILGTSSTGNPVTLTCDSPAWLADLSDAIADAIADLAAPAPALVVAP